MSSPDTTNDCGVSVLGDDIVVLMPRTKMDKEMALRLAAYLVALADYSEEHKHFNHVLEAVESV